MCTYDRTSSLFKLASVVGARRESTRLPIHAEARIQTKSDIIEGKVKNLTMNGAYLASDRTINFNVNVNSSVVITIFDDSDTSRTVFDIEAKVIWITSNGVGLQFA